MAVQRNSLIFRELSPAPGSSSDEGQGYVRVSTCTYTCDWEWDEVPNHTASIFNSKHMLWSFLFQHKHRAEYTFRRSLLKQAALLPARAENKTANDTRQLLAALLNPHSLDITAKSTVQGPLQNRNTNVGFCVQISFQSRSRQLRQAWHPPLLFISWNWDQSIKFTLKKKKSMVKVWSLLWPSASSSAF